MDIELLNDFLVEAKDLLGTTDEKLIELEKFPEDAQLLNAVFRGYHTIKGGAGFLEMNGLVALCHALETMFDALRSQKIKMNEAIMDASLIASNEIRAVLNMYQSNHGAQYAPPTDLMEQLEAFANPNHAVHLQKIVTPPITSNTEVTQHQPLKEAVEAVANASSFAPPAQNIHEATLESKGSAPHAQSPTPKETHTASQPFNQDKLLEQAWRLFTPAAQEQNDTQSQPHLESSKKSPSQGAQNTQHHASEKETQIKVDTVRLDAVLTLASEVVLAKNRVLAAKNKLISEEFSATAFATLDRSINELDRLSSNLQNAVMLTRMQPIGRLFSKYPRMVRDLARTLHKKIDIQISGNETEIDKGMIEDLADPLVHLIRNSADHGIELPHVRQAAGKSEVGLIELSAKQEGDRILINITDNGKGIDPAVLRKKAKEKNLMTPESIDALSDQQALELIFMPGFSTAEQLSSVSGRGVGMDVVKTNIKKLGGDISIHSQVGAGSTILIKIPLTLAILPVLLLKAGQQPLAIPLSNVQEIVTLTEHTIQYTGGEPVLNLRGDILRILDLATLLGWSNKTPAHVAAVVHLDGQKIALAAQDFIGREEVMVKALEGTKPKGVSGVMVDAQGEIVLILDLKELI